MDTPMLTIRYSLLFFTCLYVLLLPTAWAKTIPADHKAIHYQGRIDFSKSEAPVLIWQATTLETVVKGKSLKLGFDQLKGQVYFDLEVDGERRLLTAENGWLEIPLDADRTKHPVKLFKRSEADMGQVAFIGLQADALAKPASAKRSPAHRFIFYGDSITVGACNEDGEVDQWENFATHNNRLSYATLVAEHFEAAYRNIAVSGMGISTGYVAVTIPQVWNRLYPALDSPLAKPEAFKPNVVFLNFGENDDSFSRRQKQAFPKDYQQRYVALVKSMRAAYPKAQIVILRGGMSGGAKSPRLRTPWQQVVDELEAADPGVHHFVFQHWSQLHPRVSDHRAMADELIGWLAQQSWLK